MEKARCTQESAPPPRSWTELPGVWAPLHLYAPPRIHPTNPIDLLLCIGVFLS